MNNLLKLLARVVADQARRQLKAAVETGGQTKTEVKAQYGSSR